MVDVELARLARHPEVPVRRQIAAWLASGIRDGEVPAGARLPSVRRLAELVGVHRNTAWAAYRELAAAGLACPTRGSGVYARAPAKAIGGVDRVGGAERVGGAGRASDTAGRAASDGGMGHANGGPGRTRAAVLYEAIAVVEEGDGLRRVLAAELRPVARRAGVALRPVRPSAALRQPDWLAAHLVVGLPGTCRRLAARLPVAPEPLELRGGRAELRLVARLAPPAVLAVITGSERVRRFARELLAGWPGIALATPRPEDAAAVARALRIADVAFADASCARGLPAAGPPVRRLRCVRAESLARVAARLGVRPRRGRAR